MYVLVTLTVQIRLKEFIYIGEGRKKALFSLDFWGPWGGGSGGPRQKRLRFKQGKNMALRYA